MFSSLFSVAVATLLVQSASSSPLTTPPPSLSPTPSPTPCTKTIYTFPEIQIFCTFTATTTTSTVYTDCAGCALETINLGGIGPACRNVTTVPGTKTATVTACQTA
ncbi:hypothetical protein BKA58DRAFT_398466 [Alternaria rosae]|uniref:uncharacterized protein n=1 Tax=Alternaria rosae TaxID=1187941 RepID=UPI001E8E40B1|nr:uncharacterized protein BKA58DRAFT_398466 [Alternaria rosae]KAH6878412.1 hypothetical protein BKA58DRAFT_398466 [Alternaria rosae]